MIHVEFDINLVEIGKAVGYIVLGLAIGIGLLIYAFRNFHLLK
jgi:hypothetical protein